MYNFIVSDLSNLDEINLDKFNHYMKSKNINSLFLLAGSHINLLKRHGNGFQISYAIPKNSYEDISNLRFIYGGEQSIRRLLSSNHYNIVISGGKLKSLAKNLEKLAEKWLLIGTDGFLMNGSSDKTPLSIDKMVGGVMVEFFPQLDLDRNVDITLEDLNKYDTYIDTTIERLEDNGQFIEGLRCAINPADNVKNTFKNSQFDQFSNYMKQMYQSLDKEDYIAMLDVFKDLPSVLAGFRSNEIVYFYPRYIFFEGRFFYRKFQTLPYEAKLRFTSGDFDTQITSDKIPYFNEIFKDYYKIIMNDIEKQLETHSRVISIDFAVNLIMQLKHAIVTIFYRDSEGTLICMVYDPMYFIRNETQKDFLWAIQSVYYNLTRWSYDEKKPFKFINLSDYCYKHRQENPDINCVQYVLDAEYCLFYSLYFVYLYWRSGLPIDTLGLKRVVDSTFISSPSMKRIDNCLEIKRSTVKMMSFILTMLVLYVNNKYILEHMLKYVDNELGIPILHTEVYELMKQKILL